MQRYRQSIAETFLALDAGGEGLTSQEATQRLAKYGFNSLQTKSEVNPLLIFLNQFKSFIIYILLFAVLFSLLIGEYVDSLIILAILLLNALIGFFQELSAHKSLEALRKMGATKATVFRDGRKAVLDAKFLVPGDVVQVEAGDKVPADCRLMEVVRLKVDESALTGESVPVDKDSAVLGREVPLGEQGNMLFSSTAVVTGNGRAVVVATGMATEIGKITTLVKEAEEELTPLQRRLDAFGKKLGMVIIGISGVVFTLGFAKEYLANGMNTEALITFAFIAISLSVAAVPTALPAVVTIALSIGVKRLLRKKALVRRLSAVETLGSCDIICTDKTGTLTQNQMCVRHAWTFDGEAEVSGVGYDPQGEISDSLSPRLFMIGLACNNASLYNEKGRWRITGDPTEAALLSSGRKAGVVVSGVRKDELPFDSDRKIMSVLVEDEGRRFIYSKGAAWELLTRCSHVLIQGQEVELDDVLRARIEGINDAYAGQALRVLGFAYKNLGPGELFVEERLTFVGLQAMIDPPRPDVVESIAKTKGAGIRVIMITGDYRATAAAIGAEVGISGEVVTGEEMERLNEEQLIAALANGANIFARVVPEHKQRIVAALQKTGHVVAMTGDGVNDAPALKKANIGVAVGSGTEVAKEASDFVLLDDSFTHIVNAIEEGRGIYDNIQKSIMLLLSGNLSEVLIIFLAVLFGMSLPLTAILLLWINMVTDGAPALAYSVDPYGDGIMRRKPKPAREGILPRSKLTLIGVLGVVGTVIALTIFSLTGGNDGSAENVILAQTMVFNFVVFYECILVFVIRHGYRVPFFSNGWVWGSVLLCIGLQAMLMYTPLREVFKIVALSVRELGVLAIGGLIFYLLSVCYQMVAKRFCTNGGNPDEG